MASASVSIAVPSIRNRARNSHSGRSTNVQALTRALKILNLLAGHETGMNLTEVARTNGLAPSTAHRLLATLQQERFVRFDRQLTRWFVGVQAFSVGNAFLHSRDLARAARPYLQSLMEETQETANFATIDQGMAVYLGQAQSRQFMRAIATPGGRVFMHASALGKAMLARLPHKTVIRIAEERGLPAFTPRTLTSVRRLLRELRDVRDQGFAVDDEEYLVGMRCIAAAVFDEDGAPLGAVSISGPAVRVTPERVPVLGQAVQRVAQALTAEVGGQVRRSEM